MYLIRNRRLCQQVSVLLQRCVCWVEKYFYIRSDDYWLLPLSGKINHPCKIVQSDCSNAP